VGTSPKEMDREGVEMTLTGENWCIVCGKRISYEDIEHQCIEEPLFSKEAFALINLLDKG